MAGFFYIIELEYYYIIPITFAIAVSSGDDSFTCVVSTILGLYLYLYLSMCFLLRPCHSLYFFFFFFGGDLFVVVNIIDLVLAFPFHVIISTAR